MQIETALITAPSHADQSIFGRPLLERLLISCERAGIKRVIIAACGEPRTKIEQSLGRFRGAANLTVVDSFGEMLAGPDLPDLLTPAIALRGNLVFSKSYLARIVADYGAAAPAAAVRNISADSGRAGTIAIGPLQALVDGDWTRFAPRLPAPDALLPFALDSRPGDPEEAQWRLARSIREETAGKDAPLARLVDRRVSWRISYRLARTRLLPNHVTVVNTLLGFFSAWLFSLPGYWARLAGSLMFVVVTTLDGVDGEMARLKLRETQFGRALDIGTDAVVNFAVLCGLFVGCSRAAHSAAYLYLLALFAGGYALCGLASYRAYNVEGPEAERWFRRVDRYTSRDFAYALVIFALFNWLWFAAWGAAIGAYMVAFLLTWLRPRPQPSAAGSREIAAPPRTASGRAQSYPDAERPRR